MALTTFERIELMAKRVFFPYLPQKDAGYIANLLSEYDGFLAAAKAALPNATVVEESATRLRLGGSCAVPTGASSEDRSKTWLMRYMTGVFIVEKANLRLQSVPALVARAPFLLERFRRAAGQGAEAIKRQYDQELSPEKLSTLLKTWEAAQPNGTPDSERAEAWLRSRLSAVLSDVHWWYGQSQVREELFLSHQLWLTGTLLLVTLALAVLAWQFDSPGFRLSVAVVYMGILGAVTSIMRRMRGGGDSQPPASATESTYKELTALAYGRLGVVFGLFFGAIFAYVLMLIFKSDLAVQVFNESTGGKLIPDLKNTGDAVQVAKLLVWSFIAGFAEQLVPDVLDRIAARSSNDKK